MWFEVLVKFVRELEDVVENYIFYLESERVIFSGFLFKVDWFYDICYMVKLYCMYRVVIVEFIFFDLWFGKCVLDMWDDLEIVIKIFL